jgi:hypothetical protein
VIASQAPKRKCAGNEVPQRPADSTIDLAAYPELQPSASSLESLYVDH